MSVPGVTVGFDGPVYAIAFQDDGHFFVSGEFTKYLANSASGIVYLCPDGSVDATFDPAAGFTVDATYYPPTRLLPQADGKVVCVLADTYLIERTVGKVLTKMRYRGVDVPPVFRINADGSVDTTFNPGVEIGDTVRSAALVGQDRIVVVKPSSVHLKHLETFQKTQITTTSDVFFDAVAVRSGQLLLVGRQIPATDTVQTGAEDLSTISAANFPYEMGAWLVDYNFALVGSWKASSLRADGKYGARWDCARIAWDPEHEKAAVGMFLNAGAQYGQWDGDVARRQRGMLMLRCPESGWSDSGWDTRADATADATKQGFEPAVSGATGLYVGSPGNIYALNPTTGAMQLVATGLRNGVQCLAVDPTEGVLTFYYTDASTPSQKLYKWSAGTETLIGTLSPDTVLTCMDFHSDGTLYAFAVVGASQAFVSINKTTGAVTTLDGPFAAIANEMAFRPSDDVLFVAGATLKLYTYNISTFVATEVGAITVYNGLGFAGATLYAIELAGVYSTDQATAAQVLTTTMSPSVGQTAAANGAALSVDEDGYYVIAVPFAIRAEDGATYVTALFGKFMNESLTAHALYRIRSGGTRDSGFAIPALTNADASSGRVFAVAVSPNHSVLVVGGRFDRIDGAVGGHIMAVNALTGVEGEYVVHPRGQTRYSRGGGTRGFVFTAFAENLYREVGDQ